MRDGGASAGSSEDGEKKISIVGEAQAQRRQLKDASNGRSWRRLAQQPATMVVSAHRCLADEQRNRSTRRASSLRASQLGSVPSCNDVRSDAAACLRVSKPRACLCSLSAALEGAAAVAAACRRIRAISSSSCRDLAARALPPSDTVLRLSKSMVGLEEGWREP